MLIFLTRKTHSGIKPEEQINIKFQKVLLIYGYA